MPNGTTIPANIESARGAAQGAAQRYGELAAYEPTVGDVIKEKAQTAYKDSQDIIKPLDVATSEYMTAPQVGREKYQDIFNPFSREKLVSQYIANQALPMLSLSSILGQRFGRIEDTIGAGTRAFQAQTAGARSAADVQRQHYTDLLNEYQIQQQLEQQAWERPYQERLWEKELGKPYYKPDEGDGDGILSEALLQILLGGGDTQDGGGGMEPPPMSARPGATQEWPQGSGWYWEGQADGSWK